MLAHSDPSAFDVVLAESRDSETTRAAIHRLLSAAGLVQASKLKVERSEIFVRRGIVEMPIVLPPATAATPRAGARGGYDVRGVVRSAEALRALWLAGMNEW